MYVMLLHDVTINVTCMQYVDKENAKLLGKKIKELRLRKSKSLNNFVLQRGYLTTATWSRIENGLYDMKLSTLLRVALMLETTPHDLLNCITLDYNFSDD